MMDVGEQLGQQITAKEAAELRSTDMSASKKQKDPKKQEAGRKGAAVRQQKMETLKAELAAAKETVFQENNREHAVDTKPEPSSALQSACSASTITGCDGEGPGWGVGIGLAVVAGVALFAVRSLSQPVIVQSRQTQKPEGAKPSVARQTSTTCSRPMFSME